MTHSAAGADSIDLTKLAFALKRVGHLFQSHAF